MPWDQVVTVLNYSQERVDEQLLTDEDCAPEDLDDIGDVQFSEKFDRVRKFRIFEPAGETHWKRCSACVTTRWQCVGAAAQCGFEHYLVFHSSLLSYALTNAIVTSR